MKTITYDHQRVYTSSNRCTTKKDLAHVAKGIATIVDAYFFTVDGDRTVERESFDKARVKNGQMGLMVDVKNHKYGGQAGVSIAGLQRRTQFLYDTEALGDISSLVGKKVTEYGTPTWILGIGIKIR